jgi:hypothetical protein
MHEASFRAVAGWSNQNIHDENTLRACFALELITPLCAGDMNLTAGSWVEGVTTYRLG